MSGPRPLRPGPDVHLDRRSALVRVTSEGSTMIIAHRLAVVRDAEQILLVRDDRLVEAGTHADLLAADGLYGSLLHEQLTDDRSCRLAELAQHRLRREVPARPCPAGRS